jgi:hypothetical protein
MKRTVEFIEEEAAVNGLVVDSSPRVVDDAMA